MADIAVERVVVDKCSVLDSPRKASKTANASTHLRIARPARPLTPETPTTRSSKKRNLVLPPNKEYDDDDDHDRHENEDEDSTNHSRRPSRVLANLSTCLCPPDPRIPRPRNGTYVHCLLPLRANKHKAKHEKFFVLGVELSRPSFVAFILYRQYHQKDILARTPGLTNPEISKALGDEWRKLDKDTRSEWLQRAEVLPFAFVADSRHVLTYLAGGEDQTSTTVPRVSLPAETY